MTEFQAIVIALLQGVTELFPVSSLGHAVVLPAVAGWNIDQHSRDFLPFLVMLHLGTATALLLYFWRDWLGIGLGIVGLAAPEARRDSRRLFLLIVVATIPAVIVGFLLEKFLRGLFGVPVVAAVFLIVNGGVLFLGERLRRRGGDGRINDMSWRDALLVGVWQCGALIPGISRSGATMVGGLLRGLHHEDAAHFSFLIATPVILGATVLEVPKLLHGDAASAHIGSLAVLAAVVAGVAAFLSTAFLMRYFKKRDLEALDPFAYYCWAAGAVFLFLLLH